MNDKANEITKEYIISNHRKIEVQKGSCRYNFRCHMNAIHEADKRCQDTIILAVYIDGNHPIMHYLNKADDGKIYDNTLGFWSSQYDYYFIREINKSEFLNIHNIFKAYRNSLRMRLPFLVRIFSDVEN